MKALILKVKEKYFRDHPLLELPSDWAKSSLKPLAFIGSGWLTLEAGAAGRTGAGSFIRGSRQQPLEGWRGPERQKPKGQELGKLSQRVVGRQTSFFF